MKEIQQILLDLKRRIFKPVYFLSGEEPYFIDLVSDFIEQNTLGDDEREFNQDIVYGKDVDLAGALSLAKQFPMMSDHRVVIVKEAQHLTAFSRATGSDEGSEKPKSASVNVLTHFTAYLQNPQKTTILVFCYKYKTIDKRSAVAKALQKHAVFVETKKLYDNQLPDWISGYVKDNGRAIGPRAAVMLAEFIGNDLSRIAGEIDKLMVTVKKGEEITAVHVQDNVGISREYNVFELQEALGARDILKANRIVSHFAANEKDNPVVMVVASLYNYFMKLFKYHWLPDKSKGGVAKGLGVHPFFADTYMRAAANFQPAKLAAVFSALRECDLKSKGVGNASVPGGELLRELVYKVLH